MIRARPHLLLLLAIVPLAVAACETQKKPLTGFDTPPPGAIVLDPNTGSGGGAVVLWPIFDLPLTPQRIFRPRLNGQDVVLITSQEGFYDYAKVYLQGWTGGWDNWFYGIPAGTYVVELVDETGQSWGQSPPVAIPDGVNPLTNSGQLPAAVLTHFDGQAGTWAIDPATQDADTATDEITVTNLLDEDVVVERCLIPAAGSTTCASIGTVAGKADLRTVETVAASSKTDYTALSIHLARDASQSYQRNLVQGAGSFGSTCQVERIFVHGTRPGPTYGPAGSTAFALSTCYGYGSGGT